MADIFDIAEHTYCINLDSRTDRWIQVTEQFGKVGIENLVQRISAIVDDDPRKGCLRSHCLCVKDAIKKGFENILILEDDVCFLSNYPNSVSNIIQFLERDTKWDLFYLGGNVMYPAKFVQKNVFTSRFFSTHAYIINRRAFRKVLNASVPIDKWYAWNTVSYGLYPMHATQMETYSDIRKKVILNREKSFDKSYNLLVKPIAIIRWINYFKTRYLPKYLKNIRKF